jgi:hypothetical protein
MNLFATPGLGSLMGGRIIAGLGQLTLVLIGFGLVCVWFYRVMSTYYKMSDFSEPSGKPHSFYWSYFLAGFLFVGASWLWSLITSLRMVAQAKTPEPALPGSVPPRITK